MVFGRGGSVHTQLGDESRALEAWARQIGWRRLPAPHPEPPSMERAQTRTIEPIMVVGSPPGTWHRRVAVWERRTANLGSPITFANSGLVAAIAIPPRPPQSPVVAIGALWSNPRGQAQLPGAGTFGPRTGRNHAGYPPLSGAKRHFASPWGFTGAKLWSAPDTPPAPALTGLAREIEAHGAWLLMGERELEVSVPLGVLAAPDLMVFVDRAALTLGRPAP